MQFEYDPYLERYLKEYQDNPRSRIFAPLAEAYRKSGLVDEAIEICKEGLQYHPSFISGMVALARAYLDKGLYTATIRELEKVVSEVPDNYLAQKLLAQSYLLVGDNNNALKAYKMVLFLNPNDEESRLVITKIEHKNQEILDQDIEEISQDIEEDVPLLPFDNEDVESYHSTEASAQVPKMDFQEKSISNAFKDIDKEEEAEEQILTNISTMTMGELLASQGHKEKALEVYKKILEQNPDQILIREKIEALEQELGVDTYKINEEKADDERPSSELPDTMDDVEEDLDEEWIFKDPSENITLLKLKSLLNKIRLYRQNSSCRKH